MFCRALRQTPVCSWRMCAAGAEGNGTVTIGHDRHGPPSESEAWKAPHPECQTRELTSGARGRKWIRCWWRVRPGGPWQWWTRAQGPWTPWSMDSMVHGLHGPWTPTPGATISTCFHMVAHCNHQDHIQRGNDSALGTHRGASFLGQNAPDHHYAKHLDSSPLWALGGRPKRAGPP